MHECYKRNRFVRIICQGDDDVDLLSVYVETSFSNKRKSYSDQDVFCEITDAQNVVVTGSGGAGKTFFMRKLWLDTLIENRRTPIFLELRKLNDLSSMRLDAFIRASISTNLPENIFQKFCEEGRFVFILDGFDELPKEMHDGIQAQIIRMAELFGECSFVVSSRPDLRFNGWASFKVFEAEPFSLNQIRELCRKIPFDETYRKKFLKSLNEQFYERYHTFLSNPLLSIMMMMTFRKNMNISRKMGIFYDEAFTTLYQWHDSTKAFKRHKSLDIQQFRRSFGAFCLLSYSKEKYDFSRTELEELIEDAGKLVDIKVDKALVLDDYERNVNLIRQDGTRYYFIHRSFQEYFAAWALTNIFPHKFSEFCDKIENRSTDSVIQMCYDLQRTLTIRDYIATRHQRFSKEIKAMAGAEHRAWGQLIESINIHLVKTGNADSDEDDVSFGLGVEMNKNALKFYRNVYRMMHGEEGRDIHIAIYRALLNEDLFRTINKIIARSGLNYSDEAIRLTPDFESLAIRVERDDADKDTLTFNLTDEEAASLRNATKALVKEANSWTRWCAHEISFAKESDLAADDMFFSAD